MNTCQDNFVERCLSGSATADEIDDYIDLWHADSHNVSLYEFLGMSREEYAVWVEKPDSLGPILLARHAGLSLTKALEFASSPLRVAARAPSAAEALVILDWLHATGRAN